MQCTGGRQTWVVLTGPRSNLFWRLVNSLDSVPIAPSAETRPAPARQFRFSQPQRQRVIKAYESGQTMASLAAEYKVKRESISKLLRRAGVAIRKPRQMTQAHIDEAAHLYSRGLSLEQIGAKLGWDHNTIYRHLKKRGVVMRGPNDWQH